jgi:hypothetical protein
MPLPRTLAALAPALLLAERHRRAPPGPRGRARARLRLDAEVEREAKLAWRQPLAGKEAQLEGAYELSGTARSTLTLEP